MLHHVHEAKYPKPSFMRHLFPTDYRTEKVCVLVAVNGGDRWKICPRTRRFPGFCRVKLACESATCRYRTRKGATGKPLLSWSQSYSFHDWAIPLYMPLLSEVGSWQTRASRLRHRAELQGAPNSGKLRLSELVGGSRVRQSALESI